MTWLREYGAFIAASIAAIAAILNGSFQARRDKRAKDDHWLRELRIPRYVEFIRSADACDMSIFSTYGDWDTQDMGPAPKDPLPLPEAQRQFHQALAEVLLVGPNNVARTARRRAYSLWRFTGELEAEPYLGWPEYTDRARNEFFDAATMAIGLTFDPDPGLKDYKSWLAEQRAIEKAGEAKDA